MALRKGKKSRDDAGISTSNIMNKRRNKKGVSFDGDREAIFDNGETIMAWGASNLKEKDMSKTRKIASDFFDADTDDLSTEPSREAIFDEAGAIMGPDKVERLSKGQYESGKIRNEFSGLKDHQDWSSAKAQRKQSKAKDC